MKSLPLASAALLAALAAGPVLAQEFPVRPITIVVPFAAGGPSDTMARLLAVQFQNTLKQTVLVENAPGAGGTVGADKVARASPDGYTILLHHIGMSTAPALYKRLPFDPLKDFEPIGQIADVPMTVVTRTGLPATNLKELVTWIKANKDKVTLANAGLGAASHLCGMLFQQAVGIDMTTVPYKGTAPAMNDLVGGQVDILCDQTTQTVGQIKAGKIRGIAATVPKRIAALPDLPTTTEQGMPGLYVVVWHGLYAPRGTPKVAIERLSTALAAAIKDPTFRARIAEFGAEPVPVELATPAGLRNHLAKEIEKWTPIIRKAGVFAD
jgi:tripartite-type tricarboxylate transporter receptor subunit TctC